MSLPELALPLPPIGTASAELAFAAAFAAALRGLHLAGGGAPQDAIDVERAAQRACEAIQQGHACVDLADADAPGTGIDLAALRRSPVVVRAEAADPYAPLVLKNTRLYLHRYWAYERGLAQRLRALNREYEDVDSAALAALLDRLFPAQAGSIPDWQKIAAATAVLRGLCVISGGPGTGKTTTVLRILAVLLSLQPDLRVAIAAPTGKAAARLQDAIRTQLAALDLPDDIRARLPSQAQTVHRLLGIRPDQVQPRYHASRPLPFEVVVVDEASMLDLALAGKLVAALPPGARLILLGDKDQLAAVEAGAVYAELSALRHVDPDWAQRLSQLTGTPLAGDAGEAGGALRNAVTWLDRSYRFGRDSGIGRLAAAIRNGEAASAQTLLRGGHAGLRWNPVLIEPAALAVLLAQGYAAYMQAVRDQLPPAEVLRAFDRYRVLCATRSGDCGSLALSALLDQEIARQLGSSASGARWFAGRAVMVSGNDYALRLYNGDIGVALPDPDGRLLVHFPASDGGLRSLAPARLVQVESAFALTVHKSQGSEFEGIDLVIDAQLTRGLTRELIYTGITRARSTVGLWCEAEVLNQGIERRLLRRSALLAE